MASGGNSFNDLPKNVPTREITTKLRETFLFLARGCFGRSRKWCLGLLVLYSNSVKKAFTVYAWHDCLLVLTLQFCTLPIDSTLEIRRIFCNKTFRPSGVCQPRSRRSSEWNHRALYIGSHNNKVYAIVKYVRLTCAGIFSDILTTTQGLKSNTIRYIRYDTRCYFIVRSKELAYRHMPAFERTIKSVQLNLPTDRRLFHDDFSSHFTARSQCVVDHCPNE